MHELSLMQSVLDSVEESAARAGATRVYEVRLKIGEMTEVVDEALRFAFECLTPGTLLEGAELVCDYVEPRSHCFACGADYTHDRFHVSCPACGSIQTTITQGKELYIDSIEAELPDEGD